MVHHHMAITEIEQLQIISSLVHSSLVVNRSYRRRVLMLKVTRTASYPVAVFLVSLGLIMFSHHDDRLSPIPSHPTKLIAHQYCESLGPFSYTPGI